MNGYLNKFEKTLYISSIIKDKKLLENMNQIGISKQHNRKEI